jgi:hypothetical protein
LSLATRALMTAATAAPSSMIGSPGELRRL